METIIGNALDELLNQPALALDEVLDRHFSLDFRQRTNGNWEDRASFVQHAHKLRALVARARIEVLEELRDGDRYADRHRIQVIKRDGSQSEHEVYLFAQMDASGRFLRIEETTLMLKGSDADRDLGSVK